MSNPSHFFASLGERTEWNDEIYFQGVGVPWNDQLFHRIGNFVS